MSANVTVIFGTEDLEPAVEGYPDAELNVLVYEMAQLDNVARARSLKPLSAYVMTEEEEGDRTPPFLPITQGLATVRGLIDACTDTNEQMLTAELREMLAADLRALERCLVEDSKGASRFYLMIG